MSELTWYAKFTASDEKPVGDATQLTLKGVLIDTTENKNNWVVEKEDFQMLAKDFVGKQLRTDHAEKVANVLGVITQTEVDDPHEEAKAEWDPATPYPHIHYVAEVTSKDQNLIIPIKMGYVTHVSPAVDAREVLCAKCRKPMFDKHIKACKCTEGGVLLKNMSARELSIVVSPAYSGTVMKSYGFAAACDKEFLSEEQILSIVIDELSKRGL